MVKELIGRIITSLRTNITLLSTLKYSMYLVYGLTLYLLIKYFHVFSNFDIIVVAIIGWVGICNIIYLSTISKLVQDLIDVLMGIYNNTPMDSTTVDNSTVVTIDMMSNDDLEKMLNNAIKSEDFEYAQKIIVEINKRKN